MSKKLILCLTAATFSVFAAAQSKPASHPKPATSEKSATKPDTSATSEKTSLPSEDTVNSFLYQWLGFEPTTTWKISSIKPSEVPGLAEVSFVMTDSRGSGMNTFYVTSDGKHALLGEIMPFGARPFEDARQKLEKGVNGPARGPAKAAVTVVEFSDLQCPHCKKVAPAVDQLVAQEPDVHFVFQNFPLPSHNWAEKAAGYADCVSRSSNDAFWKFIDKTFEEQSNITESNADEKLKAIATESGANADEVAACSSKPETQARIEASLALGKSVGVNGTPTIFINGRALSGDVPEEVLKKLVDFQARQAGKQETAKTK